MRERFEFSNLENRRSVTKKDRDMLRILAWLAFVLGGGLYLLNVLNVTGIGDNRLLGIVAIAGIIGIIITRRTAD